MVLVIVTVGIGWPVHRGHVMEGFSMSLSMFR